jgi:chemotaxis signal transduction protein
MVSDEGDQKNRQTQMAEIEKTDGAAAREMITFLIGIQEFCIDVMMVREIRGWTPATPVAHAPAFVSGVINLRGTVLPIIDFAARLGTLFCCRRSAGNRNGCRALRDGRKTI